MSASVSLKILHVPKCHEFAHFTVVLLCFAIPLIEKLFVNRDVEYLSRFFVGKTFAS